MKIYQLAAELFAEKISFCLVTVVKASPGNEQLTDQKGIIWEGPAGMNVAWSGELIGDYSKKLEEFTLQLAGDCLANQQLAYQETEPGGAGVTVFMEPVIPDPELVILGAGHIARPLAGIAKILGFDITIYDDRPDFANEQFFPGVKRIICDSFANIMSHYIIKPNSMVVVVTRGHKHDLTCLHQLVGKQLAYLGMIGSRRRTLEVRQFLLRQGFANDAVDFIHAPIGLDIGADTPEEIAVSILAEVIKEKRKPSQKENLPALNKNNYVGSTDRGSYQVLKYLAEQAGQQVEPVALATIVKTAGSTPRKAGAKMVVTALGQTIGTIGGGCGEAEIKLKALDVVRSREAVLVKVNMTNDVAEDEGMVCGGNMEVFIEPV